MMRKRAQARMDELLSAYLDGELSPKEQARLEARLAADPDLRARLEALRRTVALVRHLPQVQAPRHFLLTPAMIASAQSTPAPRRRWLAPALTFATATSALLCAVVLAGSLLRGGATPLGLPAVEGPRRVTVEQTPEAEIAAEAPPEEAQEMPAGQPTAEVLAEAAREAPEGTPSPLAMAPSSPAPTPAAHDSRAFGGVTETAEMTGVLAASGEISPTVAAPLPSTPTPEPKEEGMPSVVPSPHWPLVGGLALLTLGLTLATILAWLSRRR